MNSYIYSESCTWKFPMPLSSSSCSSFCFHPRHVTVFYSEQHHQYLTSLSSYCCSQMKSSRGSLCWDTKARTFLERKYLFQIHRFGHNASGGVISHLKKFTSRKNCELGLGKLIFRHTIASE